MLRYLRLRDSLRIEMKATLPLNCLAIAIAAFTFAAGKVNAQDSSMIVTTSEGVGAFNSTLSGTSVEDFNNLVGTHSGVVWDGVGTFDNLHVINADQYGGAPGAIGKGATPYAVEGLSGSGAVKTTTLTLNTPSSYFGLYWSAGDSANNLKFYSGNSLVANFSTANLMDKLAQSYYGNPNTAGSWGGKNAGEPYGFINFIGGAGTTWDSIVFSNTANSGFEADNYTVRTDGWNPVTDGALPGTPVVLLETIGGVQSTTGITSVTAVDGKITIATASGAVNFAPAVPGAPAPPMTACLAFAGVLVLQALRRNKVSQ